MTMSACPVAAVVDVAVVDVGLVRAGDEVVRPSAVSSATILHALRPTGDADPATRPCLRTPSSSSSVELDGLERVLELRLVDLEVAADGDEHRRAVGLVEHGLQRLWCGIAEELARGRRSSSGRASRPPRAAAGLRRGSSASCARPSRRWRRSRSRAEEDRVLADVR